MDKPSDYGSDIRGSNPLGGTTFLSCLNFSQKQIPYRDL